MEFRVLGPVEIRAGDRTLDVGHARQRAVLVVLLLDLGRVVPAGRLIDRVWGEDPPAAVRNALYGYIGRLRAILASTADGHAALSRRQGGYLLEAGAEQLDLHRFRSLIGQAAAAADDDGAAEKLLREALGLWHGTALAGVDSPWLNGMRDTLEVERHAALLDLNDIRLRLGQHPALAAELAAQVATAPADERLIGQLMLALYQCGRQADALRWYEQTRSYLAEELGAHPGPDLRELHQQILRAEPALAVTGPAAIGKPTAPVPRELPADVAGFTGRAAELGELDDLLLGPQKTTAAVISAVSGTAGVGKTALAVHWAHHAAGSFRDGQLYVNLRGYGPGQPMAATAALAVFLRSLGVPSQQIPKEGTERAARYRSLLATRQMLIMLDNASSVEQVRPLLPGHHECAVVVTSRDSLAGLIARDGARRLDLDLLPLADAVALLRELIGARVDAEPDAAVTLAGQCARLPLALRVAAELAAARPGVPLAELVTELGGLQQRLDLLQVGGDPATSVRAVFSWSYHQLSDEAARMFRLLGLHPGPDISVPAAASLAAITEPDARRLLGELARVHLIAEHRPGRYAFHDLLRAYAADQARAHDSQDDRDAAVGRVLDHYLHTAARAAFLLDPTTEPVVLAPPGPGAAPEQPADRQQALAWFEAEYRVLLAAVSLAAGSGFDGHAWQLPWAMTAFLRLRGHWQERAAAQRTALAAATRLSDTAAQALSSRLLANTCADLGDHDQASHHYASSLPLYQRLGNRLGEARAQQGLGHLAERQGRYADALAHCEQALRLHQAIGDKGGAAITLNNVGWYHCLLGDYQQARAFCQRSLSLSAEIGDRRTEGMTWDSLGYAEHHLRKFTEAAACYQHALSIVREARDRFYEADILTRLGDSLQAAGNVAEARDAWQQALAILDDLHHADAEQVRAKLASTNDHASANPSA
jgi:DNA-binding SARP family transcriptional activator